MYHPPLISWPLFEALFGRREFLSSVTPTGSAYGESMPTGAAPEPHIWLSRVTSGTLIKSEGNSVARALRSSMDPLTLNLHLTASPSAAGSRALPLLAHWDWS